MEERDVEFNEMPILDKLLYILDIPFNYARKVTMPTCEPDNYDKFWCTLFPIPGLFFLFFTKILLEIIDYSVK